MKDNQLVTKIKQLISPLLSSQEIELIDLELKGAIGNQVLKIYVDVEGGINLDQCVELSRQISDLLDTEDVIASKYRLEVSSPGTDRPLKTINDFRRNIGRQVSVNYLAGDTIEGYIRRVDNSDFYLESNGDEIKVPLSSIRLAKLILKLK